MRILTGSILFLLGAVLAGCADARVPTSDGDDPDGGSDADTDADADTDGDTDADGDCAVDAREEFESATLPSGWEIDDFDADAYGYGWEWSDEDNTTGGSGGHWWINGAHPVAFDDRLVSATYTRGECPDVALSFEQDFSKTGADDYAYVQIQVNGGTWQTLDTLSASATGAYDADISSYLPSAGTEFRIRLRYVAQDDAYWKIDDFELFGSGL